MPALSRHLSCGVTLLADASVAGGVTLAFTERTGGVSEAPFASLNLGCNEGRGDFGVHAIVDGALMSFCPFRFEGRELRQRNAALAATDGFDALLEAVVPDVAEEDLFEGRTLPGGAVVGCATLESVRAAKVASGREKDAHDVAEIDRIARAPPVAGSYLTKRPR